jgi:MFS family permease
MMGGVLADRHPKRKIMLIAHVILMLLSLTLAILVITGLVNIWHVLIIAFCIGTVHAFEIPTRQSFIMEMVDRESLLNAIALNSSAFHAARMVGPLIAGFIMGPLGLSSCFFINSLSFLAIIFALLKISTDFHIISEKRSIKRSFREGLRYVIQHRDIYRLLLIMGTMSFFGFPYISFLPVYARDILNIGEKGLGILMGCAGGGAFTGALILALGVHVKNKERLMTVAGILFPTALLIFSLSYTPLLSYIMLFIAGFSAFNMIATGNSIIQLMVPDEIRGRVMSYYTTMFLGMAPLGNFFIGSIATLIGTSYTLAISASLCLVGMIVNGRWKN